ncbi:MAG TPA: helix-turn-helix domain-containing protein [Pseudonocardiaceae bacterium]
MNTDASRPLRADAARNAERIARAARDVFTEQGPDAPLEEIARRAGLGVATLYRRFPDKAGLVRAALELSFADHIGPLIEQVRAADDPYRALVTVIETSMHLAARDRHVLAAAHDVAALTAETAAPYVTSLATLVRRAQDAGRVRDDLVPEDLVRIMVMLVSVLSTMTPGSDGWRRYLALVLDSLAPPAARPLPPVSPLPPGMPALTS